jgi:hypothetical protein
LVFGEQTALVVGPWGYPMFVAGVDAYSKVGLEDLAAGGVRVGSGVSKPQAAFWASLSTLVTELLDSSCAPWVV